MISTKSELKLYLDADKFALGMDGKCSLFSMNLIWHYEICLRKYEYYTNHKSMISLPLRMLVGIKFRLLSYKLGFSVPINSIGPGLRINHYGLLVINTKCKIGKWCDIHQGVNIGTCGEIGSNRTTPTIGDFCYIGPGAKLFGGINIGEGARIGANSVVNKDVPARMTAYGIPMSVHTSEKELGTIASKEFEQAFLKKYPQYRSII